MRRLTVLLVSLLVLSQATACKKKKPPPPVERETPTETTTTKETETHDPTPEPSAAPEEPPAETWLTYAPEPKKFSILFPLKPKESSNPTPSAAGMMTQHDAQASYKTLFYGLGWMDFPAGAVIDPKKALDGARDGAVSSAKGKLRSEKAIKLSGKYNGRDIVFDVTNPLKATGYLRIYIVGKRFYQTLVVEPAAKRDPANVEKFLSSLTVK